MATKKQKSEVVIRLASDPKAQLVPSWTVTSNERSAPVALIAALEAKGRDVGNWAKDIISKPAFVVSRGVTYRLVIIRGDEFTDEERTTKNIFAEAERRRYRKPPAEVAALLRKKFAQEELGFPFVVVMHEPIHGSSEGGVPAVLGLGHGITGEWLDAWDARPREKWFVGDVFIFLAP